MWSNNGSGWGGMGAGGWVVMTLVMLAFWALVAFGVVALFRSGRSTTSSGGAAPQPSPEQLLDERFARGEIDADEYQARRSVLRAAH
jgi:putative membrane protein